MSPRHIDGIVTATLPDPLPPDPATDAILLDFDGTLVPLAPRPEAVSVSSELVKRLHRLSDQFEGRLALISGRAISVLDDFGFAGLACAGSHGAEWRLADGSGDRLPRPDELDVARQAFTEFAEQRDGVLFEDKPLGAALHYRLAPNYETDAAALAERYAQGLHVQHGHCMVELRVPGADKGTAIAGLMQRTPFAGFRPIFAGDDVTDEDGFAIAAQFGGYGILVGSPRKTRAHFALSGPKAVNAWLARALETAGPMP